MKKEWVGQKVLATTHAWFLSPDGKQYRAVWGELKGIHQIKDLYGFTPTGRNANWAIEIGDTIIAGCQILYGVLCPQEPPSDLINDWQKNEKGVYELVDVPAFIYHATIVESKKIKHDERN